MFDVSVAADRVAGVSWNALVETYAVFTFVSVLKIIVELVFWIWIKIYNYGSLNCGHSRLNFLSRPRKTIRVALLINCFIKIRLSYFLAFRRWSVLKTWDWEVAFHRSSCGLFLVVEEELGFSFSRLFGGPSEALFKLSCDYDNYWREGDAEAL